MIGLGMAMGRLYASLIKLLFLLALLFFRVFILWKPGRFILGDLLIVVGFIWYMAPHPMIYIWAPHIDDVPYLVSCEDGPITCIKGLHNDLYFIDKRDFTQQYPKDPLGYGEEDLTPQYVLALPEPIIGPSGFQGFGRRIEQLATHDGTHYSDAYLQDPQQYSGLAGDMYGIVSMIAGGVLLALLSLWESRRMIPSIRWRSRY